MPALTQDVVAAVKKAGVAAVRCNRKAAKVWDKQRVPGDPINFCGWYWHQTKRGRVVSTDKEGPFPCESAALADAFKVLQLRT